jgi:transcriptional regulator with XRE-family HTH domain
VPRRKTPADVPSARAMLAEQIKLLREKSRLSLTELSHKTGWTRTQLHALERQRSLGGPEIIEALDIVYGTTPLLMGFWKLAKAGRVPFRHAFEQYLEFEGQARLIYQYAPCVVPGLLQTEAYAREMFDLEELDDIDDRVAARLGRKAILTDGDPPKYRAILDEAVLRRPLLDPEAWHDQLAHLVETAMLPNVTIQVLPQAAGMHGLMGANLILLSLRNGGSVAYLEGGRSSDLKEDPEDVDAYRAAYDRLRDLALSPRESVAFIERLMETPT